ncbi:MAG: 4Fe-4S binding protein [Candidatus Rokubacteria bacterium]|nr:4Fe-4S binding protein [Candidatus Rokubacteria bacterium]
MIARLLGTLLLALLPAAAAADGGHEKHGGAAPLGTTGTVTVQGYQVELLTYPSPLAPDRSAHLVAKVFRSSDLAPVPGGRVLVGFAAAGAAPDPEPATEQTWAGHYAVAASPTKLGAHQVRVVLAELEGRRFEPPLVVDFPISVARASSGMGAVAWTVIALVAGIGVLAMYAVRLRARTGAPAGEALDLLRVQWLRRLLTSRALQPSLQIPLLVLMAVVVLLGFYDVQDGGANLATKLTWTIWWAGIIFTFVLAGRVWCLACPFGALNEWTARLAAPLRRLPKPFRNIWWATGMFVLLTWADEQLGVVRSPRVTAWIVLFFAAAAVAVGLFYERRSFCRHLCPIGGLIGIYSMTAPLELRSKSGGVCAADPDKSCYRGGAESRGCPMFEFPASMDRNNYCNLCGECVTSCSRDNLVLRFRAFGKDLWASGRRVLDEAYLAVALVGLTLVVTAQMLSAWPGWTWALSGSLPHWVRATLKPVTYLGLVESAILLGGSLVVVPLLVLCGAVAADRLAGAYAIGVRRSFVLFSYMFIPVGLAVHLAHNLSHLLTEGGGIVPVVQRAVGLYMPWPLGEPDWQHAPLAPEAVVALLQVVIIVGFFVLSLVAGHRLSAGAYADPRAASRALVPMAALSCVFTVAAIVLLNLPMGMRHGM